MGLTDKQKNILLKNGYTENGINAMSYEQASGLIGEILSRKKPSTYAQTEVRVPEVVSIEKPGFKMANRYEPQDKKSFYVAYSKDLLIALLQTQVEYVKAGFIKDVKQLETSDLVAKKAVEMIKQMKKEFE